MSLIPAISIDKLMRKKYDILNWEGEFEALIGKPELKGLWLIYGEGGSGKTTISIRLMKGFAKLRIRSSYNSIEMKTAKTLQDAIARENLLSVKSHCQILEGYTVEELRIFLKRKRSPKVIFIDSLQFLRMNSKSGNELTKFELKDLITEFKNKLFIVISHSKNSYPKGSLGDAAYYASDVVLHCKDLIAYPDKSRYGGTKPYNIREFN